MATAVVRVRRAERGEGGRDAARLGYEEWKGVSFRNDWNLLVTWVPESVRNVYGDWREISEGCTGQAGFSAETTF